MSFFVEFAFFRYVSDRCKHIYNHILSLTYAWQEKIDSLERLHKLQKAPKTSFAPDCALRFVAKSLPGQGGCDGGHYAKRISANSTSGTGSRSNEEQLGLTV